MKRLLIIDDDPRVRELFGAAFAGEFSVAAEAGGEEGVEACRRAPPDVILLDLCMPRFDGLRVLRELGFEDSTRTVPVVVFSSSRVDAPTRALLARLSNVAVTLDKIADFRRFPEAVRRAARR